MKVLNTYAPVIPAHPGTKSQFLAVLTKGNGEDMAVYVGIVPDLEYPGDENPIKLQEYNGRLQAAAYWVAGAGRKLQYRDALTYFPNLPANLYRA